MPDRDRKIVPDHRSDVLKVSYPQCSAHPWEHGRSQYSRLSKLSGGEATHRSCTRRNTEAGESGDQRVKE